MNRHEVKTVTAPIADIGKPLAAGWKFVQALRTTMPGYFTFIYQRRRRK